MLPTWVLGPFNQQKLLRGQMRNSGKALLGLMLQHEGVRTRNRFPYLHLLGGAVCRDHAQSPASALGTSEVAVGFWPFCTLLLIICPNCTCMQLFLVSYSLFVFCCSRRRLSRCKCSNKGSQVPGISQSQNDLADVSHSLSLVISMLT